MKTLLSILIIILLSGCCIYQDIQYSIKNPNQIIPIGNFVEVVYLNPDSATHEDSLKVAQTDYLTWGYKKRNKSKNLGRY